MESIPVIWRIDVEPDEHQPRPDSRHWSGFVAMAGLVDQLRPRLADLSGAGVHPTWFLRLDPDIERCFGRTDFVVDRYHGILDRLLTEGDPLGIHVHFYRWDEKRRVAYSDVADLKWMTQCIDVAAGTFEMCFKQPTRRSSQGGYFLSEQVIDHAIARGIAVDVTAEPGLAAKSADPSFGAYSTAPSADFLNFPRAPYYPSLAALSVPANSPADARPILMVPLTAYDYHTALAPWPRRLAQGLLGRPRRHLPLNPWKVWPSPETYWDLVARAVDEGPARYVAFAVRTHSPDSEQQRRVSSLLEYLPKHPIARRLCFVDPLSREIRDLADASLR